MYTKTYEALIYIRIEVIYGKKTTTKNRQTNKQKNPCPEIDSH